MPRRNRNARGRECPRRTKVKPTIDVQVKQFERPWRYRDDIYPGRIVAVAVAE